MDLEQLEWNNRIGLFGAPGTGKSWLMKWIIKEYIRHDKRRYYIIIDDNPLNIKEYIQMGFYIQELNRSLAGKNFKWKNFIQYHEKICFVITDLTQGEIHQFLNEIANAQYILIDSLFAIDEAHLFLKPGRYEPENILRYERGGRKSGCDFILSSHRTTDVSPDVMSLLNIIISFRINEPNTVDRLIEYYDKFFNVNDINLIDFELNIKQKKLARDIIKYNNPAATLKNLPNRWFIYSNLEKGTQEISCSNILK